MIARGDVAVSLRWVPEPKVSFELEGDLLDELEWGTVRLMLSNLPGPGPTHVDVGVGRVVIGSNGLVSGTFRERVAFGCDTVTSLVFLLTNWPAMLGDWLTDSEGGYWRGRVELTAPPWRIRLDARPDHEEVYNEVRATGSYGVTHIGQLDRLDGSPFTIGQTETVVAAIDMFLALARGYWTPPLLLVGYDGDEAVWREWLARRSSPWRGTSAWLSPRYPDALATAFPLFMQRWRDPAWRDSLILAVSWFIEANGAPNAETSIVLAQVALELLGWVILVEERRSLSRTKYKEAPAKDNIRALLTWAEIPLAIPQTRMALMRLAGAESWSDGPAALAGFRNLLTHPRYGARRIFAVPTTARVELRELALWYVELVLLRFTGYRGESLNRNKPGWGVVEPVPWS